MKLAPDFVIQEFVPKTVYERFRDNSIWFLDPGIIQFCQWLRDYTQAPVVVNNWHLGGTHQESGLRESDTNTGSKWSQHKAGRAVDVKVQGVPPEAVREIIRLNFQNLNIRFGISTIEKDTPTWCHVDTRYTGLETLFEVPYK